MGKTPVYQDPSSEPVIAMVHFSGKQRVFYKFPYLHMVENRYNVIVNSKDTVDSPSTTNTLQTSSHPPGELIEKLGNAIHAVYKSIR